MLFRSDRNCANCNLELNIKEGQEMNVIGIEKLLSDEDATISLIPSDNPRMQRRGTENEE